MSDREPLLRNSEPAAPGTAPGVGAMDAESFRTYGVRVIEMVADYLDHPERWAVLPAIAPGELSRQLPTEPPGDAEPVDAILADYERLILPATTHWNHPGFFAYFSTSASGIGILAETLSAALNVNAMLWRSGPAATELEFRTVDWLRQLLGMGEGWEGTINDTASISTLHALAAAREAAGLGVREDGLAGRPEVPRLRVYCSREAHTSVDKALLTLGLGLSALRRVDMDDRLAIRPDALAAAISEDRASGVLPIAVVATVGTTSTTAVDPLSEVAGVCEREGLWLHVDAAYGGAAALLPEMRWVLDGCDRADSLVVNPHKWLFVPLDCSVLFTRRPEVLRRAFSLVPEFLTTPEGDTVQNLMDYGVALGRRFRALKLWFVLRYFGAAGLAERLREHMRLARVFAEWVDAENGWERLAPTTFSVVVFRHRPRGLSGEAADQHNQRLLERVNASGEVFLSHTRVADAFALRLAIGNIRTQESHVARAWELLRAAALDPP